MDPFTPRNTKLRPEMKIQKAALERFREQGWFAKATHGNQFQVGFPDSYLHHPRYGPRWVEFKRAKGSRLESSQVSVFGEFEVRRIGVWIMTGAEAEDLRVVFHPPNWRSFLKPSSRPREGASRPLASTGPERAIQEEIKATLRAEGWYCLDTFGGTFSQGFPDIYSCHVDYGSRWIEVKNPRGWRFTTAQRATFRAMADHGCGIWLLTSSDEVNRLFHPANLMDYLDV